MLAFDGDAANLEHIAEHTITAAEAESALQNPALDLDYQDEHDKERFAEVGATSKARMIVAVTTWHGLKTRVVTAFGAPWSVARE